MQMTAWGFGRITLACTVAGTLMAGAISFAFPVHYASQTIIYLTPAERSTLAGESADRMVNNLERSTFSRESLTSIILEYDLYPRERGRTPLDEVIREMKRNIRVALIPPGSAENARAFVVQFDYRDPLVAQQVDAELTSRLIESNLKMSRRLNSPWVFRVMDPPSLPLQPAGPNRTQFAAAGLFAGLLSSLTLGVVVRLRRGTVSQDR